MELDLLYKTIEFGLGASGSAGIIFVFLKTVKDKTADTVQKAAEAWEQIYHATEARLKEMSDDYARLEKKFQDQTAFIERQEEVLLNYRTEIAKLKLVHEKEIDTLNKIIREKTDIVNTLKGKPT
jgi:peptidoglycan hydrolase CwlO-like protein